MWGRGREKKKSGEQLFVGLSIRRSRFNTLAHRVGDLIHTHTLEETLWGRGRKKKISGEKLLVACLTFQQHPSVSEGRIFSDNYTCCHIKIEVADQTFYLSQSPHTDTGPTKPRADRITPGAWLGSHWSTNFRATGMTPRRKRESNPDLPFLMWTSNH